MDVPDFPDFPPLPSPGTGRPYLIAHGVQPWVNHPQRPAEPWKGDTNPGLTRVKESATAGR
jgi:hypothetical protein